MYKVASQMRGVGQGNARLRDGLNANHVKIQTCHGMMALVIGSHRHQADGGG